MENLLTERCVIKSLTASDIDEAVKLFTNQKTREFLGGAISRHEALLKLKSWIAEDSGTYFCVRLKNSSEFIGLVCITPYYENSLNELSYEFLPEFWGNGYALESTEEILNYCKSQLNINKLAAETQTHNIKSKKLLLKLGFTEISALIRFGEEQTVYVIEL